MELDLQLWEMNSIKPYRMEGCEEVHIQSFDKEHICIDLHSFEIWELAN